MLKGEIYQTKERAPKASQWFHVSGGFLTYEASPRLVRQVND